MNFYTGVGSRKAPEDMLAHITSLAVGLKLDGWWLRSGGAKGADRAFESGAGQHSHIYLPWDGFEGRHSGHLMHPTKIAYRIASEHHPIWSSLGYGVRSLIARNVHQVLGDDCQSPSTFVVCWTTDGATRAYETSAETGGTGVAIRIADTYNIPVWNLKNSLDPPESVLILIKPLVA